MGYLHGRAAVVFWTLFLATSAFGGNAVAPKLPEDSLPVPLMRQATDYSCGAAAMQAVLYYWQVFDGSESDLYSIMDTHPQHGTHPRGLVKGAKSYGLKAQMRENLTLEDLRAALARGETAIVAYQAWRGDEESQDRPQLKTKKKKRGKQSFSSNKGSWRDEWSSGHYSVLVGMDEKNIYLMDPSAGVGYGYIPLAEFEDRWHDYEDRDGYVWKYQHLAVFVQGTDPLKEVPGPLVRIE